MGLQASVAGEWREARDASKELGSFVRHHDWKKSIKNSFRRKYWIYWILAIILTAALILLAIYQDPIVRWFEPRKQDIIDTPASWAIPIAVLVILSFPPLGGHEVVILVVGLIWGLWIGFAIVSAGTFLGEMACYIMFKYFFSAKAAKIEQKSIFYACVARMMREGGLWILVVVRFSAIPGHVVTAMQSTIGVGILKYSLAVIITLPKQLAIVYLGVMFGETDATEDQATVNKQRKISLSVLFLTALMTVLALYIVYMRARALYPQILLEQKARAALAGDDGSNDGAFEVVRVRRGGLVEATVDGDVGPYADAPSQFNPEYDDGVNYGGKRPSKGDIGHSSIMMVPSRTNSLVQQQQPGMLNGQGQTPWSAIEERERREAQDHNVYGPMGGDQRAAQPSFTHLPLQAVNRQ
ncbi:hypothetical protein OIV83_002869 [Microbotryomycetes sp. JL201]|nr:hypothetical protein OIV83_002869 [Microbotryomycetes sp. JL201]